jgi:hypothetical protein
MLKGKIVLVVLICFVVTLSFPSVTFAALPAYVPDRGVYDIRKSWAFSAFIWNESGFTAWYPEAYEHEFRVNNEGFAQYDGYWSSNLPQAYLDLEDNQGQGHDEFVIGSDDAEGIRTNTEYSMYIDLKDQNPSVTSASFILEAERCQDVPGQSYNIPLEYYTITSSTAPDDGTWGGGLPDSLQQDSQTQCIQENDLHMQSSERLEKITVFFKKPLTVLETEQFILNHQINPLAINFKATDNDLVGGFNYNKDVHRSLQDVKEKLKLDLFLTESLITNNQLRERSALEKVKALQQKMLNMLEKESIAISALVLENTQEMASKLKQDPNVSFEEPKE